jgi:hypothetical protein
MALLVAIATLCTPLSALELRLVPLNQEVASRMISLRDRKEDLTIKRLEAMRRSDRISCSVGEQPLQIITLDREDPSGKPETVPILLPEGLRSPLILLLPDPDHPTGLRPITIDESEEGFQWGGLLFYNITKTPYTIKIDTETKLLPEDVSPIIIHPGGLARNIGVQIYQETKRDDILFSGVWEHDPNFRKIIVLVPPKNEKHSNFDLVIIPQDRRVKE